MERRDPGEHRGAVCGQSLLPQVELMITFGIHSLKIYTSLRQCDALELAREC